MLNNKYRLLSLILSLFFCQLAVFAQIRGTVKDASTGEPLPFANVFYDGKGVGTTTDDDGNFTIAAHVGWNKLTISFVGYQTQVVQISSNTRTLDIKLQSFELKEVLVKPKRERYSRKNNPAVEFMKKVVAHKKQFKITENNYYSYNV